MARKANQTAALGPEGSSSRRAFRLGLACIFAGVLALGWVACLSYNVADGPGTTVWPQASPVKNYAGVVGATFSHYTLTYLGSGTYMALLFGSMAVVLVLLGGRITDLILRAIGMALLIASTSTAVWLLSPHPRPGTLLGGAGWLGTGCGIILHRHFGDFSWMIDLVSFVVGMILAADELVVRLPSVGRSVWDQRKHLGQMADALRAAAATSAAQRQQDIAARTVTATPRVAALGKTAALRAETAAAAAKPAAPAEAPAAKPRVSITQAAAAADGSATKETLGSRLASLVHRATAKDPSDALAPIEPLAGGAFGLSPEQAAAKAAAKAAAAPAAKKEPAAPAAKEPPAAPAARKEKDAAVPSAKDSAAAAKGTFVSAPRLALPAPAKKSDSSNAGPVDGDYALPALNQLIDPEPGYIESQEAQVELKREILQQTLNDFAVEAQVVGHMTGPVITLFELSLAPGVKVSQIANLANDIARALAAPGVRIVSPLPGKDTIGIEAPNSRKETVRLKQPHDHDERRHR